MIYEIFNNKLELFLAKRALVLFAILAVLDIMLVSQRWAVLAGLTLGGILSLIRFGSMSAFFSRVLLPDYGKQATVLLIIIRQVANQVFTIIFLALSLMLCLEFFAGAVVGILIVPLVIMINGITEGLGITKNNFD